MATAPKLVCKKREITTKGKLKAMKREDWIPGVVYGKDLNLPIAFSGKEINRIFTRHGYHGVFSLEIEGENEPLMVLVREVQRNPIKGNYLHVDLLRVRADEKINSMVSVQLLNEEVINRKGLIVQTLAREIEVSCFPDDIPDSFVVDLASLEVGDTITAEDLDIPDNVELLSEAETVLATILLPSMEEEEEEEEDLDEEMDLETEAEEGEAAEESETE